MSVISPKSSLSPRTRKQYMGEVQKSMVGKTLRLVKKVGFEPRVK